MIKKFFNFYLSNRKNFTTLCKTIKYSYNSDREIKITDLKTYPEILSETDVFNVIKKGL